MKNLFNLWNSEKQNINNVKKTNFYINQREIWYRKMGKNIGCEEDGKSQFLRPVLVLKKIGNLFFTVALTSKGKLNNYFYHKLEDINLFNHHKKYIDSSYIIVSQVKVMDKKRFFEKIGTISHSEFLDIQKRLKNTLF